MLTHKKEAPNSARFTNLETGSSRFDTDGLRDLKYTLLDLKQESLYLWILVDI